MKQLFNKINSSKQDFFVSKMLIVIILFIQIGFVPCVFGETVINEKVKKDNNSDSLNTIWLSFDNFNVTDEKDIPQGSISGEWEYASGHGVNDFNGNIKTSGWYNIHNYPSSNTQDYFVWYLNGYNSDHMGYSAYGYLEIDNLMAIKGNSLKLVTTGGYNSTGEHGIKVTNKERYIELVQNGEYPISSDDIKVGAPTIYFLNTSLSHATKAFPHAKNANRLSFYVYMPSSVKNTPSDNTNSPPNGTISIGPYTNIGGHWYHTSYNQGGGWTRVIIDGHPHHNNAWSNADAYPYSGYSMRDMGTEYFNEMYRWYIVFLPYSGVDKPKFDIWIDEIDFFYDDLLEQNNETINTPSITYHPDSLSFEISFSAKYKNNKYDLSYYEIRYSFSQIDNDNYDNAKPCIIQANDAFQQVSYNEAGQFGKNSNYYPGVWAPFKLQNEDNDSLKPGTVIYFAIKDISDRKKYIDHPEAFDVEGDRAIVNNTGKERIDLIKRIDYKISELEFITPVPKFASDIIEGEAPLTVQFTDNSINAGSWEWDFDNDGNIDSTIQNPSYTYKNKGKYTVYLKISNSDNSQTNSIIKTNYIIVNEPLNNYLSTTIIDFGSIENDNIFGLTGWNSAIKDKYTDNRNIGSGGTTIVVGNNGDYCYQGVKGNSRIFKIGHKIKVTWYNNSDEILTITPRISFNDPDRVFTGDEGKWYFMEEARIPAKGSGYTIYDFDKTSVGNYSLVNVNGNYNNKELLICDKIELLIAENIVNDITPPTTPTQLSAYNVSSRTISLSWNSSIDNLAVSGYRIFRDGKEIGTCVTNSYSDTSLMPDSIYSYQVSAYDESGNESEQNIGITVNTKPIKTEAIIVDHKCTDINKIPESAVIQAKDNLHIAYGHTSHGSQLISGMNGLDTFLTNSPKFDISSGLFVWNDGPKDGYLDIDDYAMSGDVGYYPKWVNNTRSYLGDPDPSTGRGTSHSDVNVIIWSWCGQVDSKYASGTLDSHYLTPMSQLEEEYPGIVFVYMTGHVDHWDDSNNKAANQMIRDFVIENNKVLYDFADIESYDPDGNYYEYPHDNCDYYSSDGVRLGNWCTEWQNSHEENIDWWASGAAHSNHINGNLKGYAAWCLWARLGGWDGNSSQQTDDNIPPSVPTKLETTEVTPTTITIQWEASTDNVRVYQYIIYRNGLEINRTCLLTYKDTDLKAKESYIYSVAAVDSNGNISEQSQIVNVTTQDQGYLIEQEIISIGDEWKYFKGLEEPPINWNKIDCDDSHWLSGPTGIGYADNDDATILDDMQGNYVSFYARKRFENNFYNISSLLLTIDYDDAFVAYINGTEIAQGNISGRIPDYNEGSGTWHETGTPETYNLNDYINLLNQGMNILAIRVINGNVGSSDVSFLPSLSIQGNVIPSNDKEPPTTPENLIARAISSSQIDLSWEASTDNIGVEGYSIYRDGVLIDQVAGTNYSDVDLLPETTYSYYILAYDYSDNQSEQTSTVTATSKNLPECTESDWSYSDGICQSDNTLTRIWTKTGLCEKGVTHSETEIIECYDDPSATDAIIVDHKCTDITQIPESAVIQAKNKLHIAYGHTSHGSQLISGMNGLDNFLTNSHKYDITPGLFVWNDGPREGYLDLDDRAMGQDVGYYPQWVNNTKNYLGNPDPITGRGTSHSDVNVIIWSWCGQVDSKYASGTLDSHYLTPMSQLEEEYPGIVFVYMTGHVDHWDDANNKAANQMIRDFVIENSKVLYDFADIESYDPDGKYYEFPHDNCDYYSSDGIKLGNWCIEWQNSHEENIDWWASGAAHSNHINGNLKGYAAWWLWTRLGGWPGIIDSEPHELYGDLNRNNKVGLQDAILALQLIANDVNYMTNYDEIKLKQVIYIIQIMCMF